jgi:hypothetical protein
MRIPLPPDPEKYEVSTMFGYSRGHQIQATIILDKKTHAWFGTIGKWSFSDTGETFECGHIPERPCVRCGKMALETGEDACLGHIPGVQAACCGHGVEEGYINYEDGREETIPLENKNEINPST